MFKLCNQQNFVTTPGFFDHVKLEHAHHCTEVVEYKLFFPQIYLVEGYWGDSFLVYFCHKKVVHKPRKKTTFFLGSFDQEKEPGKNLVFFDNYFVRVYIFFYLRQNWCNTHAVLTFPEGPVLEQEKLHATVSWWLLEQGVSRMPIGCHLFWNTQLSALLLTKVAIGNFIFVPQYH